MARVLIAVGLLLILLGLFWPVILKLPLGKLPGDFVYRRDNFTLYLPLGTSLLISLVLSLIFWLFRR